MGGDEDLSQSSSLFWVLLVIFSGWSVLAISVYFRRRHNKLLGSVIPDSVNDAFDPANHHVLHSVVPAGVKSYVTVSSVENALSASILSPFRASIYIITQNGYFREYTLQITKSNESLWSLEREFNLLDTIL